MESNFVCREGARGRKVGHRYTIGCGNCRSKYYFGEDSDKCLDPVADGGCWDGTPSLDEGGTIGAGQGKGE